MSHQVPIPHLSPGGRLGPSLPWGPPVSAWVKARDSLTVKASGSPQSTASRLQPATGS